MASRLVLFLLSVMLFANELEAKQNSFSNIIRLGSSLSPKATNSSWVSDSGVFAFGFYPKADRYAIGIWLVRDIEKTVVWTANRDDPPLHSDSTVELSTNGMLRVRTEKGNKLIANTSEPAASACLLDSGNFVLYSNKSDIIWQSFDYPTDTILGGQNLSVNDDLVSSMSKTDHSSGSYILSMQNDGNLVAYFANSLRETDDSYWNTETYGLYFDQLSLDHGGLLFLRYYSDSHVYVLANSSDHGEETPSVYRATLDPSGIFRLYAHQIVGNASSTGRIVWSALSDLCEVRGHCGFNSYCSANGMKTNCDCYPGFVPSKPIKSVLDCEPSYRKVDCKASTKLTSLEYMYWDDDPYSMTSSITKKACGEACQEDCDCAAVLYINGTCNMYTLPIKFGRRTPDAIATALLKVPSENYFYSELHHSIPGESKGPH